jgi:hypothetical protein
LKNWQNTLWMHTKFGYITDISAACAKFIETCTLCISILKALQYFTNKNP